MTYNYSKALIIAPHSDDEIFTLPFIYSPENNIFKIDLLLIQYDELRFQEALRSAKIHNFNLIRFPANIKIKESYFHLYLDELYLFFNKIWDRYDLVLSPAIEGGHQDHDSVSAALILSKEKFAKKTNIFLYSTYRNIDRFPYVYTCGLSKKISENNITSLEMPSNWFKMFVLTIFSCYRSQLKTWALLFMPIMISFLRGNLNKFIIANNLNIKDIKSFIPKKPLYQIYRNCNKDEWLKAYSLMCKKIYNNEDFYKYKKI